jgi:hypothetical protein
MTHCEIDNFDGNLRLQFFEKRQLKKSKSSGPCQQVTNETTEDDSAQ